MCAGGLVAFPTETVYGLAADATNPTAIERLNHVKGRPPEIMAVDIAAREYNYRVSMVVDLDKFSFDQTASFDDKTMIKANDDQLNDWMMPLIGAFESTFEICSIYAKVHESALKKNINLRHFSLYKQEKPIASITLSVNGTIARIDDVGTLPEFQGKGYATSLMKHVLSLAKTLGANYCFLEASASGLSIYQKLGFEELFKNNIYSRTV